MALDMGPPVGVPSEAEIQDLERQLGFRLPDRFRALLPQLNGASPKPNVIKTPDERYSIDTFERIEDIIDSKNAIDSVSPSDLLLVPFATDGIGNWYCVVAADCPEEGAVYFVDHELEGDEAFLRIAGDLDEMIERAEPDIDMDDGDSEAIREWIKPGRPELLEEKEGEK